MKMKSVGIAMSLLATSAPAWAAERTVTEVKNFAALAETAPAQLSPGDMKYSYAIDTWKAYNDKQPVAAKVLALYPGYAEATYWSRKNGVVQSKAEPLVFFQTRTKTVLNVPIGQIDLKTVKQYASVKKLVPDLQFAPAPINNAQLVASYLKAKQPQQTFGFCKAVTRQNYEINLDESQPPASAREPWCSNADRSMCFEACLTIATGIIANGINGYNMMQSEDEKKDVAEGIQAEVRYFVSETERGDAKGTFDSITKVGTEVGGVIELSIFYANQIIQWGKVITVLQRDPGDANRTIMTNLVVVAIKSHSYLPSPNDSFIQEKKKIEIRKFLKGESPMNRDDNNVQFRGLLGGIPRFTQDLTQDFARLLETHKGS